MFRSWMVGSEDGKYFAFRVTGVVDPDGTKELERNVLRDDMNEAAADAQRMNLEMAMQ